MQGILARWATAILRRNITIDQLTIFNLLHQRLQYIISKGNQFRSPPKVASISCKNTDFEKAYVSLTELNSNGTSNDS